MKRCVVTMIDERYINICATRMEMDDGIVCVFFGEELVAIINPNYMVDAHMSERREERGRFG